ncbi:MAG: hypothetical protein N3H31_07840 [Candidatus Nezhaarchaeota archaeon]|nr:hypothetical protein [Candidatus Nezhaarchaeota archaeon]
MSHFTLIKIKIKDPNVQLLKKAIEQVAKELNATIITQVQDYYGRGKDVIIGLKNNEFYRGVGVIVEGGEIKLIGDFWGVKQSYIDQFQQLLTQNYTALAVQASLQQLGYQVSMQRVQDKIYVKAVTTL